AAPCAIALDADSNKVAAVKSRTFFITMFDAPFFQRFFPLRTLGPAETHRQAVGQSKIPTGRRQPPDDPHRSRRGGSADAIEPCGCCAEPLLARVSGLRR